MAGKTGLEPATSAVTGQRSNQLSYVPRLRLVAGQTQFPAFLNTQADTKTSNATTKISLSDSSEMLLPTSLSGIFVDHPQQLVVHGLSLLVRTRTNGMGSAMSEVIAHQCPRNRSECLLR